MYSKAVRRTPISSGNLTAFTPLVLAYVDDVIASMI